MGVLAPIKIGKGESETVYIKGTKDYAANSNLDINGDGRISKGEATEKVIDKRKEFTN